MGLAAKIWDAINFAEKRVGLYGCCIVMESPYIRERNCSQPIKRQAGTVQEKNGLYGRRVQRDGISLQRAWTVTDNNMDKHCLLR